MKPQKICNSKQRFGGGLFATERCIVDKMSKTETEMHQSY